MDTPNVYLRISHRTNQHFAYQEWFEIKNCPKCGKANDMMRKYCRACGASLIQLEEETAPEPVEEPEEVMATETPSFSEDAPLVRPSAVASEQVEIDTDKSPISKGVSTEAEDVRVSESTSMDMEKGREVVKDILEKVRAAEARSREEMSETVAEPEMEVAGEDFTEEPEAAVPYDEPMIEEEEEEEEEEYEEYEEEEEVLVEEIEPPPPEEAPIEKPVPVAPAPAAIAPVSAAVDEADRDEKVREYESDIKAFNIELGQLQAEFDKIRARLDEEVDRYLVAAETKRTRAESLERELKLAKNEYNDANKEHKNAENRRKKELSNAEKRIRDVEKKIKKAEDAREKRIRDLEKERLKREEEARKG